MVVKFNLQNFDPVPEGTRKMIITEAKATPSGKPSKIEITFKDIETYKEMLENYEKVSEEDKAIVNATKKAKADKNYEKLLKSASNAIVAAKTIAGKVTNRPYTLATTAASASLAGLLIVGLIALKKKKENL